MYEYTLTNGEAHIDTSSFCKNLSDVKKEVLSLEPGCIHMRNTYPNGFIFESLQYTDRIVIRTNKELRINDDGTLTILDK